MAAPDLYLLGTASTVKDARQLIEGEVPDVMVVDIGLPDGSGLDVIRMAHEAWPRCAIAVATTFADEQHVIRSIEAGASGYLLKNNYGTQVRLAEDIRFLHDGGSPMSPMIARYVLARFRDETKGSEVAATVPVAPIVASKPNIDGGAMLSARELEVLRYITKGFTYEEISKLMSISRYTVMNFVRRIYGKLQVRSKIEAIDEARSRGWLNSD
jgi:DNA-binding NarL/FixJ family response regulator